MCYMEAMLLERVSAQPADAGMARGRVGVRELRQNLSVHLDRVKLGQSLLVTERGRVVAVLMPSTHELSPVERLIAEGRATPASRSLRDLPRPRRTRAVAGASEDVISDLRGERLP
jgi:prevent-host-death family protein